MPQPRPYDVPGKRSPLGQFFQGAAKTAPNILKQMLGIREPMSPAEASDTRGIGGIDSSINRLPRTTFKVVDGPDTNMTFDMEGGTCRAMGRALRQRLGKRLRPMF